MEEENLGLSSNVAVSSHQALKTLEENVEQGLAPRQDDEIEDPPTSVITQQSVAGALDWFNTKLATPYLRCLNMVALRTPPGSRDRCNCSKICFNFYKTIAIIIVVIGYVLQYMACYRRDRGFGLKEKNVSFADSGDKHREICLSSSIFSFILPCLLHFAGYIHALYIFKISGEDSLQSLMERVFLFTTHMRDGNKGYQRLLRVCQICVACCYIWVTASTVVILFMMSETHIKFTWISPHNFLLNIISKFLLASSTIWQDIIQATVIANYCVQTQFLIIYLQFLREKLNQQRVHTTTWVKEFTEFKYLLKYINECLSPAVGLFSIVNISWALTGILWLFNLDHIDKDDIKTIGASIVNCIIWITISITPLIQAAHLTTTCKKIQGIGHEMKTRSFVHQYVPDNKLDSILLYASTLKLNARIFRVPINEKYLIFLVVSGTIFILVLGQLHYINAFI